MRRFVISIVVVAALAGLTSVTRPPAAATASASPAGVQTSNNAYWTIGSRGMVTAFGSPTQGSASELKSLNGSIIAGAASRDGKGYWLVGTDGGVFTYGTAPFFGSTGNIELNRPVVGMAAAPDSAGYWFVASDGGVFSYGSAKFFGSMGGKPLNKPIVGMAATPSGNGYWLVASDGGIFSFGDAKFFGSTGSTKLNQPIVGMSATPGGAGYWLVASDGGIFSYGQARFAGSTGSMTLNKPITGMASTPSGGGYWLVASDGGIFSFGDAPFLGSAAGKGANPIVGIASLPTQHTSEVSIFYYPWYSSVDHDGSFRHWDQGGNTPPDYIGADYWPEAGAYSSADATLIQTQMAEIKAAGVDTIVISWWGRGSWEDSTLAVSLPLARAAGLRIAAHIEPYDGRTGASVAADYAYLQSLGVNEFYIYQAEGMGQTALAAANDSVGPNVRVFGESASFVRTRSGDFAKWAAGAHFTGIYSYAGFGYSANDFAALCDSAHALHMLCSPSVAPGFSGLRATAIKSVVDRRNGATYDASWAAAINAGADLISITSFNEWHEGTQIEPAIPHCTPDGICLKDYRGAYGDTTTDARTAYLKRTQLLTADYKARFKPAF